MWYFREALAFSTRFTWLRASQCARAAVRDVTQDAKLAVRRSLRHPGFACIVVLTLALGIGANVAVFRILDAVRLRSLPVPDPDRLAIVEIADMTRWQGRRTTGYPALSNALWERIRDEGGPFESTLAWANASFLLESSGIASARGLYVSGSFFEALGVSAVLGRVFGVEDDQPGCGLEGVVVSHAFWERALGGDPAVVGRTILLDTHPVPIVGVTPAGFTGVEVGRAYDVAVPICAQRLLGGSEEWLEDGNVWWLTVMGRIPAGSSKEAVDAELESWSTSLFEATLPPDYSAEEASNYRSLELRTVSGATGVSSLRGRYGDVLTALLAVTALVLLIVCTNLANLFLARGTARQRELAVRRALGASRGRLLREAALEGMLLGAGGAAVGSVLATTMSGGLMSMLGDGVSLDLSTRASSVVVIGVASGLSMVVFGIWPAWRASGAGRERTMDAVRDGRGVAAASRGSTARRIFVVTQVATSFVLLFGALLFSSALRSLLAVDMGFDPNGVTVARVDFRSVPLAQGERPEFKRALLDAVAAVPGVSSVAEVRHVPLGGTGSSAVVSVAGADLEPGVPIRLNGVTPDFLETMSMPLRTGHGFTASDASGAPVAIVTSSLARRVGLGTDPVGSILRVEGSELALEVIGLVDDAKYFDLREEPVPTAFLPKDLLPDARSYTDFVIRSSLPNDDLRDALLRAATSVASSLWIEVRPLDDIIDDGLVQERIMSILSAFFGALASLVAAIGLYGVMSQYVAQRRSEIGVRVALGAKRGDVLGMVLAEGGALLLTGLGLGAALAFVAARPVESLLFGLDSYAVPVYASTALLLTVTSVIACYVPARRALRIDPREALAED